MHDLIETTALHVIQDANDVLETREILERVQSLIDGVTRIKLFYRLTNLRGEGKIKGKFVGPGKGVWIWWTRRFLLEEEEESFKNNSNGWYEAELAKKNKEVKNEGVKK